MGYVLKSSGLTKRGDGYAPSEMSCWRHLHCPTLGALPKNAGRIPDLQILLKGTIR
jgi:hypothetical protein